MTRKLVTNEEAIKCLTVELGLRAEGYNSYLSHYGKQDKAEEEFLDSLQTAIAALREQPCWISVEERLPDRGEKVLCYMNFLNRDETIQWGTCITENTYQGVLVGSNPRKHVWEWQGEFVTHWMHLPEPPKEEV